jgi:hypothetical protein
MKTERGNAMNAKLETEAMGLQFARTVFAKSEAGEISQFSVNEAMKSLADALFGGSMSRLLDHEIGKTFLAPRTTRSSPGEQAELHKREEAIRKADVRPVSDDDDNDGQTRGGDANDSNHNVYDDSWARDETKKALFKAALDRGTQAGLPFDIAASQALDAVRRIAQFDASHSNGDMNSALSSRRMSP